MIIVGQHRSAALAERHRKQLERKRRVPVTIISRRNAKGKNSPYGQFFRFKIGDQKLSEWIVTWELKSGNRTYHLDFLVYARTSAEARQLVNQQTLKGKDDADTDIKWASRITWDSKEVERNKGGKKHVKKRVELVSRR